MNPYKEKIKCRTCGRTFIAHKCLNRKYCSRRCFYEVEKAPWIKKYQFKKGMTHPRKGDHTWVNSGTFQKGHTGLPGESNPSWKNGMSAKKMAWKTAVFERDDYTCRDCGERGKYLNAHHIAPQSIRPELKYDIANGVTLCRPCHKMRHQRSGFINQFHSDWVAFNNGNFKTHL